MENENENVLNNKNSVPKNFGPETGEPYFIIDPETPGVKMYKVTKIEGLQEFYSENQSVISDRAMAEKFMRRRLGKKFKDFNHVWNDLNQFTEKQYA